MALQILQWNCKSIQNKLAILQCYLTTFKIFPDILCLKETHLNQNSSFLLPGYKLLQKDRPNSKKSGGICYCIKNNLSFSDANIPPRLMI